MALSSAEQAGNGHRTAMQIVNVSVDAIADLRPALHL